MFLYYIAKLIKKINLSAIKNSSIDKTSKINDKCHIVNTSVGRYSYISDNTVILNSKIGSFCSISSNVMIGGASHPTHWVSTSPVFYKGKNPMKKNFSNHNFKGFMETEIGNDVWIGSNVVIKSGVNIADGAIIGMGSVVTKDIGSYEIWGGNPARIIRKRFDDETILKLKTLKWFDWDENKIKEKSTFFSDVNLLIREVKNENTSCKRYI